MGKVLLPRNFLRVADKFFPGFALGDAELSSGSLLLYLILYYLGHKEGECAASQKDLAKFCRCSMRSIQTHLSKLEALGYITSQGESGAAKTYVLTLTDHVTELLDTQGIEFQPAPLAPAQNLPTPYAESSQVFNIDVFKNIKNINTPPSSRSKTSLNSSASSSSERVVGVSLAPVPNLQGRKASAVASHAADFENLWAAWPVKKDKYFAQKVFFALQRNGALPPVEMLLAKIADSKKKDSHWLGGYAPTLTTWLRGKRWEDEIFIRSEGTSPTPSQSSYAGIGAEQIAKACIRTAPIPEPKPQDFRQADELAALLASCGRAQQFQQFALKGFCRSLSSQGKLPKIEKITEALNSSKDKPSNLLAWLRRLVDDEDQTRLGQGGIFGNPARCEENADGRVQRVHGLPTFLGARQDNYEQSELFLAQQKVFSRPLQTIGFTCFAPPGGGDSAAQASCWA